MSEKLFLIFTICSVVLNNVSGEYSVPNPKVTFFRDRGFEVSINAEDGISMFEFHAKKNILLDGEEAGEWDAFITSSKNGRFIYLNPDVKFNLGDVLNYWIKVHKDGVEYPLLSRRAEVRKFGFPSSGPLPPRTKYEFQQVQLKFIYPRGFEVSIPAEEDLTLMEFHGQVNKPFTGQQRGDLFAEISRPENGKFVFRDYETKLNAGDRLYFWIKVIFRNIPYNLEGQEYYYQGGEIQNHNGDQDEDQTETPTTRRSCEIGVTKVNGNSNICKNSEIFYEDFNGNSINLQKWRYERKFGAHPDYEFVLYSDRNARITNNNLKIEPSRNTERHRRFQIEDCTGLPGTVDCVYDRKQTGDIFPPILSTRINTKDSFSFQYGRVEIRAKLPRGDWMVPLVLLEPKGFKYEKTDYKSGQIRIAFIENNPNLEPKIKQGPLLGAKEPYRTSFMNDYNLNSFRQNWDSEFHTFVVEWRPDTITTFIDHEPKIVRDWRGSSLNIPGSDDWNSSQDKVTPFDQEFFMTLGVSVGGVNDFESGTTWDRLSPIQKRQFVNDTNWINSWTENKNKLEVEYVKVTAL